MRAFVTGGTGFLGGKLAEQLCAQGHEVVALARKGSQTERLREMGARIAVGDVTDPPSLRDPLRGADAVFHVAAWYELGVSDEARMEAINVGGTRNVLGAAAEAGVAKIVHCSSVAALGATGGRLADESKRHEGRFGSPYERTKHEAHRLAQRLAAEGAPIRIALPGTIFGPGDKSLVAWLVRAHLRGWLRARVMADLHMSLVYVDDCAAGLALIAERGAEGGEYNLVGQVLTVGDWMDRMSAITGLATSRLTVPMPLVRASARLFPLVARAAGLPPSLARELLAMSRTGWAFSSQRARDELGWRPSDFDEALARTLVAFDRKNSGRGFRPRGAAARRALEKARTRQAAP